MDLGKGKDSKVRLADLFICLSDAMDFIDPAVVNHHKQVAFISYSLGREMGLPPVVQRQLVLAGLLHDIGAFTLKERIDTLAFEIDNPHLHAERGHALLQLFDPISDIAEIVRHHHLPWDHGSGVAFGGREVPAASHILHLADRVAVLLDRKREVLSQVPSLCETIRGCADNMFMPRVVDAFMGLAAKEYFWLDAVSPSAQTIFPDKMKGMAVGLTSGDMSGFARLFSRIIDFKSPFTATHSSGVAVTAEALSKLLGWSGRECRMMKIAGYLHDLGKLAVPVEILDKPSGLTKDEFSVVRHHTYYTFRLLETIPALAVINKWAAYHHERLDGTGYPFHLKEKELPLGSQIMAVADVFTAITEDRPYRAGMPRDRAVNVLDGMVRNSALNGDIIAVLKANFDEVNKARMGAQSAATKEYGSLSDRRTIDMDKAT